MFRGSGKVAWNNGVKLHEKKHQQQLKNNKSETEMK
jgi:hypothetical protein